MKYYGYNNVASNYKVMLDNPTMRQSVVASLTSVAPEAKVFRFPDGQESINNKEKFDDAFTNKFIDFCKQAGIVYVILRADFNDIAGSIRTYTLFMSRGILVQYVEASNEPYLGSNMNPKNWREFWKSIFDKNGYQELKARQYVSNTLKLYNAFINEGLGEIIEKMAFACPVPDLHKWKIWYSILSDKLSDIKYIVFHIYGDPTDDWYLTKKLDALDLVDEKFTKISTEFSAIHFGRNGNTDYVSYAFTPTHRAKHNVMVDALYSAGFEYLGYHKYFGYEQERFFSRYVWNGSTKILLDRHEGMIHEPI